MIRMKFFAKTLAFALIALIACCGAALAQGPGKPMEPPRDPAMETAARHNLARDRLQEIIDTYPDFSRMDEVVFLMGEAHLKLKKNEKAVDYYNKLLKDYPGSEFARKARERLDELKTEPEKK